MQIFFARESPEYPGRHHSERRVEDALGGLQEYVQSSFQLLLECVSAEVSRPHANELEHIQRNGHASGEF